MLSFELDPDPTHPAIAAEHGTSAELAMAHALWGEEKRIAEQMERAGIVSTDAYVQQRLAEAAAPAVRSTLGIRPYDSRPQYPTVS